MERITQVLRQFFNRVAEFSPYFFVFYLSSFFASLVWPAWRDFFWWPAFHASAVCMVIFVLLSEKDRPAQHNFLSKTVAVFFEVGMIIAAAVALLLLAACPVLLAYDNIAIAETLSVYAFYSLGIIAIMQLVKYFYRQE